MQRLNRSFFPDLPERPLKILQFGGGNFLRTFADWMVQILNEETGFNGDVLVVKPTNSGSYEDLRQQQGLYHVLLRGQRQGEAVSELKRIECLRKIINPYTAWEAFLDSAREGSIRFVVSNTTEAGIFFDSEIQVETIAPGSFPAKLTHWLFRRFLYFEGASDKGCVFLPCELIEENGTALGNCIRDYAKSWQLGAEFLAWLDEANHFCNTLVDRIVAGYPQGLADQLHRDLGYLDSLLVSGEYYHSWIIEGPEFLEKELPLAQAGLQVRFVSDLRPYRELKVRLLNGTHTLMVPVGVLLGYRYVHECLQDREMSRFLEGLQDEISGTLDLPRQEVGNFRQQVMERFGNPFLNHALLSIALNSVAKFRTRVLPTLFAYYHQHDTIPPYLQFAFAALIYMYRPHPGQQELPFRDEPEVVGFFADRWSHALPGQEGSTQLVTEILGREALWGGNLNSLERLTRDMGKTLSDIREKGIPEALRLLLHTENDL